jgi:hypothetical protein
LTPDEVSFAPSSVMQTLEPTVSYQTYGYDLGNDFKAGIEGLYSHTDSAHLGNLLSTGGISSTRVMLSGLYEFSDGNWHLKPFLGVGFGMIDVSTRLLGRNADDRLAAYQLRGGVSLALSQKLLGSVGYQWTMGSKPRLTLAGIPTKIELTVTDLYWARTIASDSKKHDAPGAHSDGVGRFHPSALNGNSQDGPPCENWCTLRADMHSNSDKAPLRKAA